MDDSTIQRFNASAWMRLVRWPNLLIIALTQTVAWWSIIYPLAGALVLTPAHFAMLCCSTVLIAAGGYIINDYFDIRIDAINKPDKVILERIIPRRMAIIVHSALNILALALAALVAIPARHPEWLLLQISCTLLLWQYSTTWKRQFMIGNVVVALMTALTVIAIMIYEPALQKPGRETEIRAHSFSIGPIRPLAVLTVFAAFAFLLTWIREIIKDMEDYKGDAAEGCITMPIRWGLLRSVRFVQILCATTAMLLIASCISLWIANRGWSISAILIIGTLVPRLFIWMFQLPKAATAAHYRSASTGIKWFMVIGIFFLFLLSLFHYG